MANLLIVVTLVAVVAWMGVSLLRDTALGDELSEGAAQEAIHWFGWVAAAVVVAVVGALLLLALT
jgi:hypothetical protein